MRPEVGEQVRGQEAGRAPGAALPLQPGRENRRLRNSAQNVEWAFQLGCLRINDNDQCYGWRKSRKCRKSGADSECSWICTARSVTPSFPGALPIPRLSGWSPARRRTAPRRSRECSLVARLVNSHKGSDGEVTGGATGPRDGAGRSLACRRTQFHSAAHLRVTD